MHISKINPFNSLFGRVFIWFWMALLVILISAFLLTKQLANNVEVNAVTDKQAAKSTQAMQRLSALIERSGNMNNALRRLGQRKGGQIVAINVESGKFRYGFPMPLVSNSAELKRFINSDNLLLIRLNSMEFVGPFSTIYEGSEYKVFIGRLLLRSERTHMSRSTVAIAGLVLAIVLSTLFCFVLVLSITRPIGALRLTSNKLAKGDLSARIEGLETRQDEVGHLAQDFNSMAERLQSLIDNQKQLMANMSHELRTPLTRLQLAVALLENELGVNKLNVSQLHDNASEKHMARIENEIVKLDEMIGQLLTIAKINATKQQLNMQVTTLKALLSSLLKDAQFEAEGMHKALKVDDFPEVNVCVDSSLMKSALENIVRNALRFAEAEVLCSFIVEPAYCAAEVDTLGSSQTSSQARFVRITISDDGKGLPKEDLKRIFEPFYRANNQIQDTYRGNGLGLSIAKEAIELHGGSIQAVQGRDSEIINPEQPSPLGGLSVIITLPIIEP